MYYFATRLYDGTVTAAYPIRKPLPKRIKEEKLRFDEDGICRGWLSAGEYISDIKEETRCRFQDIVSNRLNTRRALRDIVSPQIAKLQKDVDKVLKELEEIKGLLRAGQERTG